MCWPWPGRLTPPSAGASAALARNLSVLLGHTQLQQSLYFAPRVAKLGQDLARVLAFERWRPAHVGRRVVQDRGRLDGPDDARAQARMSRLDYDLALHHLGIGEHFGHRVDRADRHVGGP